MTTDALYNLQLEGNSKTPGGIVDPLSLSSILMAVPKNSGIQILYPELLNTHLLAQSLKPPLRELVMQMALNDISGCKSISSEGGFMVRELNTNRSESISMGVNTGQPRDWADDWVHGNRLKNNPKSKENPLQI